MKTGTKKPLCLEKQDMYIIATIAFLWYFQNVLMETGGINDFG